MSAEQMLEKFGAFLKEEAPAIYDASNADARYIWTKAWQAALATQPQAPQGAGTGLYFDRGEIEYQKLGGGGEGLFLVSTNKTVFYNTEILIAPKTETPEGEK